MDEEAMKKQAEELSLPMAARRALWDQFWREHILGPIIERAAQQAKEEAGERKAQTDGRTETDA